MRVSIMQAAFLPWLGYFARLLQSDLHIVLDHVQIDKNSKTKFVNRNRIRTPEGWMWLTVPIRTKGLLGHLEINRIEIAHDPKWARQIWRSLELNYARTPYFALFAPEIAAVFEQSHSHIVNLDQQLTAVMLEALGISVPMQNSSAMNPRGQKDELVLNLCRSVSATTYISGPFGREYLDRATFAEAGIKLLFHDYKHPEYRQAFPGFEPYMSAIDLLFNHGPAARGILAVEQELAPT